MSNTRGAPATGHDDDEEAKHNVINTTSTATTTTTGVAESFSTIEETEEDVNISTTTTGMEQFPSLEEFDDGRSVDSETTFMSDASSSSRRSAATQANFFETQSGFYSPNPKHNLNWQKIEENYQFWLRIGTLFRQLLMREQHIGFRIKHGKTFQVLHTHTHTHTHVNQFSVFRSENAFRYHYLTFLCYLFGSGRCLFALLLHCV